MKKVLVSTILILALCLSLLPAAALAAEEDYNYTNKHNNGVSIDLSSIRDGNGSASADGYNYTYSIVYDNTEYKSKTTLNLTLDDVYICTLTVTAPNNILTINITTNKDSRIDNIDLRYEDPNEDNSPVYDATFSGKGMLTIGGVYGLEQFGGLDGGSDETTVTIAEGTEVKFFELTLGESGRNSSLLVYGTLNVDRNVDYFRFGGITCGRLEIGSTGIVNCSYVHLVVGDVQYSSPPYSDIFVMKPGGKLELNNTDGNDLAAFAVELNPSVFYEDLNKVGNLEEYVSLPPGTLQGDNTLRLAHEGTGNWYITIAGENVPLTTSGATFVIPNAAAELTLDAPFTASVSDHVGLFNADPDGKELKYEVNSDDRLVYYIHKDTTVNIISSDPDNYVIDSKPTVIYYIYPEVGDPQSVPVEVKLDGGVYQFTMPGVDVYVDATDSMKEIYTVTFNWHDGNELQTVSKLTGTDGKLPEGDWITIPGDVPDGYEFGGWFDKDDNKYTKDSEFSKDTELFARWLPKVTFSWNYNGAPPDDVITTEADGTVKWPTDTDTDKRDGYEFDGWFTDSTDPNSKNTQETFTAPTTLYARWNPIVTFDYNYDTDPKTVEIATGTDGKVLNEDWPNPTRGGYTFAGWFDGTGEDAEEIEIEDDPTFTEPTELYARWDPITVTFYQSATNSFNINVNSFNKVENWPSFDPDDFLGWYTEPLVGGVKKEAGDTFTEDTTLYARWDEVDEDKKDDEDNKDEEDVPPPAGSIDLYDIDIQPCENGTVTPAQPRLLEDSTAVLTVTPDDGYELGSLRVVNSAGRELEITENEDGTYSFTMPSGGVTVTAVFTAAGPRPGTDCPRDETCPLSRFDDLDPWEWYHDGIHYCLENGIMFGITDSIFGPDTPTTRAMLVTILWRIDGRPAAGQSGPAFDDVEDGSYYADAVRWAASEGIVYGYGGGVFGPDDDVTREQMAAILWRYAQYKGYDVSVGESTDIQGYPDAGSVSEYAVPAMRWACGAGLIVGLPGDDGETLYLVPQGTANRAQIARVAMLFLENIAG